MLLTVRALTAFEQARTAEHHYGNHAEPQLPAHLRRLRIRHARALATLLGIDPVQVLATTDPHRRYGQHPAHLLIVTDTDTDTEARVACPRYRFIPDPGTLEVFHLLGPCPHCHAEVPLAVITHLADLGRVLTLGAAAAPSDELGFDPHHQPGCPRHHTD